MVVECWKDSAERVARLAGTDDGRDPAAGGATRYRTVPSRRAAVHMARKSSVGSRQRFARPDQRVPSRASSEFVQDRTRREISGDAKVCRTRQGRE